MGIKQTFRDIAPATLTHQGHDIAMPVLRGTIGPDVIDVAKLGNSTGCFTYDPGFTSTANCKSAITFIDGDKGELLYRGYPIEQVAEGSNFLAVCYLLLYGELPTNEEYKRFRHTITTHTMLNEQMTRFYPTSSKTARDISSKYQHRGHIITGGPMTQSPFEIPQQMRDLAERNIEQMRAAYDQVMDATNQALGRWAQSIPGNGMTTGFKKVQDRATMFAKQNAEAAFGLASELANAKDVQEVIALQSRFAQSQIQAYATQFQELTRLVMEAIQSQA